METNLKKLIEENKIMEALAHPFYKEMSDGTLFPDIRWKPDHKISNTEIECVPYLDGDQVRQRLNNVLGSRWQDRMEKHEDRTICILSIYIEKEWRENGLPRLCSYSTGR